MNSLRVKNMWPVQEGVVVLSVWQQESRKHLPAHPCIPNYNEIFCAALSPGPPNLLYSVVASVSEVGSFPSCCSLDSVSVVASLSLFTWLFLIDPWFPPSDQLPEAYPDHRLSPSQGHHAISLSLSISIIIIINFYSQSYHISSPYNILHIASPIFKNLLLTSYMPPTSPPPPQPLLLLTVKLLKKSSTRCFLAFSLESIWSNQNLNPNMQPLSESSPLA